jgi:hypothetical protein
MTKSEYKIQHALIVASFDQGIIDTNEYFHQIEALAAKFGEEYEEEL